MGTANGETSETRWSAYNIDVSCKNHYNSLFYDPFPNISVVAEKYVLVQIDERSGGPPYKVSVSE